MLAALSLVRPVDAACPEGPTSDAQLLEAVIGRAEAAYRDLDGGEVIDATRGLPGAVECLGVPLAPDLAVRLHFWIGEGAFAERPADPRVAAAFRAARALDPTWVPPVELAQEARTIFDAAAGTSPSEEVPAARRGELFFDGEATVRRPTDRPTVAQWEDGRGMVASAYVWPGEPLPAYPMVREASPRRTLLAVAVAGTATAGAAYGGAWIAHGAYERARLGDKPDLRAVTNALVVTSGAIGSLSVAVGIAGIVVGR